MRKVAVPAPPAPSFEAPRGLHGSVPERRTTEKLTTLVASQRIKPLDAAFLSRVYRFIPRFGLLLVLSAAAIAQNVALPLSLAAGLLTGLLLLKTQEMFVRRVLRPKSAGGPDKMPALVIVPGKYALVIATLWAMRRADLLHYAGFAAGCTITQFVVFSMAWRRLRANLAGDRKRTFNEIYVQPHKIKKSSHV